MSLLRLLFTIIIAVLSLAQQLFLFNITAPIEGLPSTCITVFNQALACDPYLLSTSPSKWKSESILKSTYLHANLRQLLGHVFEERSMAPVAPRDLLG